MTFAEKLKMYRTARNLSMSELGKRTGLARSTISKWEKGARYPLIEQVDKLARFFGCEVTDLFDDGAPRFTTRNTYSDLISFYDRLNSEGKQALLAVASSFIYNPLYIKDNTPPESFREASIYDGAKNQKTLEEMSDDEIKQLLEKREANEKKD